MNKKVKITTNIDEEVFKQIKIRAIEEDMNVGDLIEKTFKFYVQKLSHLKVDNILINDMTEEEKEVQRTWFKILYKKSNQHIEKLQNELKKIDDKIALAKQEQP